MLTRYTLMVFGQEDALYWQAHWAILSLLARAEPPFEILVSTDQPRYFHWFGDAIRVQGMSADELNDWLGPQRYFFRALIKTLEIGLDANPKADVAIYMDTDMIINRDFAPVIAGALQGDIYMECLEYKLYDSGRQGNKGAKALWQLVGDREWDGVRIDRDTQMWNTGITAVSAANSPLVKKSLAVCDAMLAAGISHRLTEQIAMSAVLSIGGRAREINVKGQPPYNAHYWGNKRGWREQITGHLASIHLRGLTLAEAVDYFRDHPVTCPTHVKRTRKWHRYFGVQPVR